MTGFWDGSGISWTMCKQSAPRSRQITAPTAHHSIFTGRMLSPNQQCQSTEGTDINTPHHTSTTSCCSTDSERPHRCCHLANNWFCYLFFFISMYTTLRRCYSVAAAWFFGVSLSVCPRAYLRNYTHKPYSISFFSTTVGKPVPAGSWDK